MRKIIALLCLLFLTGTWLLGQESTDGAVSPEESASVLEENLSVLNDDAEQPVEGAGLSVWDFVRMILVLIVVIALIIGLFQLLKRAGGNRFADTELIQILSTKTLSGNRHIHLVEVGGQYLLVGSAENSVNLLTEVSDKEAVDQLRLNISQERAAVEPKRFLDVFGSVFQPGKQQVNQDAEGNPAEFIRNQKDRLKNL